MGDEGILRGRLKEQVPELHDALVRSHKIAVESWLQAIEPRLGTSNGYIHIRNVENYLDHVITQFEELKNTPFRRRLTAAEIYVLLSAALLHDFGRTDPDDAKHWEASRKAIKNEYAKLGIPSKQLGDYIADIAHSHGTGGEVKRIAQALGTTVVDPFGEIRGEFLGALLRLADCMDTAYTRSLPEYVGEHHAGQSVGMFRRRIHGVAVDGVARMVRMVLIGDPEKPSLERCYAVRACTSEKTPRAKNEWAALLGTKAKDLEDAVGGEDAKFRNMGQLERAVARMGRTLFRGGASAATGVPVWQQLRGRLTDGTVPSGGTSSLATLIGAEHPWVNWLIAADLLRVDVSSGRLKPNVSGEVPEPRKGTVVLDEGTGYAMVVGSMRDSVDALEEVRPVLAKHGITITAWLVEHKERLYNVRGNETFEPLFHREYLARLAAAAWDLNCQVFGVGAFSYEDLASQVGEADIERVIRGVKRIAIAAKDLPLRGDAAGGRRGAIWAGADRWQWNIRGQCGGAGCAFVPVEEVRRKLGALEAPGAGY